MSQKCNQLYRRPELITKTMGDHNSYQIENNLISDLNVIMEKDENVWKCYRFPITEIDPFGYNFLFEIGWTMNHVQGYGESIDFLQIKTESLYFNLNRLN